MVSAGQLRTTVIGCSEPRLSYEMERNRCPSGDTAKSPHDARSDTANSVADVPSSSAWRRPDTHRYEMPVVCEIEELPSGRVPPWRTPSSRRYPQLWRHGREGRDVHLVSSRFVREERHRVPVRREPQLNFVEARAEQDGRRTRSLEGKRQYVVVAERRPLLEGQRLPVWRYIGRPLVSSGWQQCVLGARDCVSAKEMRRAAAIGHEDHTTPSRSHTGQDSLVTSEVSRVSPPRTRSSTHRSSDPDPWLPSDRRARGRRRARAGRFGNCRESRSLR